MSDSALEKETTVLVLAADPPLVEALPEWAPKTEASQTDTSLAEEHLCEVPLAVDRLQGQQTAEAALAQS